MAEGILTLNPSFPERDPDAERRLPIIEAPLGAGIGLALANMFKDKNKENLPEEVDKEKTPQQEPPEGEPDLLPELSKQTVEEVIRKEIKEKQQPINKIQTWEKYFDSKDEAEQVAKENNITLRDFEIPALKKQITFRKTGDGFDILFDKKLVGELVDITQFVEEAGNRRGKERTFNLFLIGEDGYNDDVIDTIDTVGFAKEDAKNIIAQSLLRDTTDVAYPSLKDIFQNLEYNKKGMPKKRAEETEKLLKEAEERDKKAKGGFISKPTPYMDRPLSGGSRDI
tara:strand:+ start:42 stop:890 length:849 start_codon:yes stop_codon:yes gene_type:complete